MPEIAIKVVIPAQAGIQNLLKHWIPCRAPLARNDGKVIETQSPFYKRGTGK